MPSFSDSPAKFRTSVAWLLWLAAVLAVTGPAFGDPARDTGAKIDDHAIEVLRASWFFASAGSRDITNGDQGGGLGMGFESHGSEWRPGVMFYGAYHAPEFSHEFASQVQLRTAPLKLMGTARMLQNGRFGITASAGLAMTFFDRDPIEGYVDHLQLNPSDVGLRLSLSGALLCHYEVFPRVEMLMGGVSDYGKATDRLIRQRDGNTTGDLPGSLVRPALLLGLLVGL